MTTEYDASHPYDGKEFRKVLEALDGRELKKTLKGAYRDLGKQVKATAASAVSSSSLAHGSQVGRSVRVRVYPWGNGFMLTVKPRQGKKGASGSVAKGYHKNRFGKWVPVALWANSGTQERHTRKGGHYRGRMEAMDFLGGVERSATDIVERGMRPAIEESCRKSLHRAGLV